LKSQLNSLIARGSSEGNFGSPAAACAATTAEAATTRLPKQNRIPQRLTDIMVRSRFRMMGLFPGSLLFNDQQPIVVALGRPLCNYSTAINAKS
jgi:hypothetical protein